MTFLNPLGLVGLLALPLVVALHFLRSQRVEREVGGLHLWSFVRERQPVGRRWRRIEGTALLALQLAALLVAALLLAGLERATAGASRHLVVVVDGSASMAGRNPSTGLAPHEELHAALAARLRAADHATIVAAGVAPRLVAGPFARAEEALAALAAWRPEAPGADLFEAARFARRFALPSQSVLLATDIPAARLDLAAAPPGIEWLALGEGAPNTAIAYADRRRAEPATDRLFVVLEHHGAEAVAARLEIVEGTRPLVARSVDLQPDVPRQFEVDVAAVDEVVTLRLAGPDALALDDVVRLAPAPPRLVGWHVAVAAPRARGPLERALAVLPDALVATPPESADFVAAELPVADHAAAVARLAAEFPRARGFLLLDAPADDASLEVAEGDFLPGPDAGPALRALGFEGVLWAHSPAVAAEPGDLLTWRGRRLLAGLPAPEGRVAWSANLALGASTIARTTAWPLLVDEMVEATRRQLPGPRHHNVAVGEALPVSAAGLPPTPWLLRGPGGDTRRFEALPPLLSELAAGLHHLAPEVSAAGAPAASDAPSWTIGVNFFAREESDLRARGRSEAEWDRAWAAHADAGARRPVVFYALLAALAALLAGWWALAPARGAAPRPAREGAR